ncbi:MAG: hypothetical protein U0838_17485 [Chloroflexota bacterium]
MLKVQLLGDARVCRDGLETRIRSRKLQLLLARLALGAPPADDAALARDIGVSLSYLRVLRSRAIREGSPLRGCFVRRWELQDVRLDVTRAHELAHRVLDRNLRLRRQRGRAN